MHVLQVTVYMHCMKAYSNDPCRSLMRRCRRKKLLTGPAVELLSPLLTGFKSLFQSLHCYK